MDEKRGMMDYLLAIVPPFPLSMARKMTELDHDCLSEGFRGQVYHTLAPILQHEVASHPLGAGLYPAAIGWFPRARHHYRARPSGADEHILIYCHAGNGWFEMDGKRASLRSQTALLIPRGKPHLYGAEDSAPWSIYWVHFSGDASAVYSSLLNPQEHVIPVSNAASRKLVNLFRECCAALAGSPTRLTLLFAAHALRHLFGVLLLENSANRLAASAHSTRDLTASIELMRGNLNRTLTLRELARQVRLSPARYSALFKAQTGVSPVEHHIRLRIQAACRLLDTTQLSIKEVAGRLGYEDTYYFSRLFRKVMGRSPLNYRAVKKG